MVDREGFEPSVPLRVRILSRDVVSAAHPSIQVYSSVVIFVINGGQTGIRTLGGMTLAGFQERFLYSQSLLEFLGKAIF